MSRQPLPALALPALALLFAAAPSLAANGLSDGRVSMPDGPGSIGGVGENVDINANMGSSSFTVPIEVPRGATAEMTPDLALSYSSGQGLGVAGIGWALALPAIARTTAKGLPEYDTDDLFSADGSELVYVGDAASAREYRARFEGSFARYRWHDAATGEAGYWTAEYPDGRTAWFGATADGTLVPSARVSGAGGETFAYYLVELQDTVGRRIVHTYTKTDGWPLLDEVQYGFGGQATPRFSVRAAYEARPDVVSDATPGHVIELAQRLTELAVYSDALLIRSYELVYEADADAGGMSRLERVSVYGRDGGRLPIEHTFRYSRTLGGACDVGCEQPFLVDMGTLQGGVNIGTGRAALIDINGDALPDVVSSDETGLHTFHVSALTSGDQPRFSGAGTTSTMGGTAMRFLLGSPRVQIFDVNGDGFVDVVDQVNATALCNYGEGDWSADGCVASPEQLPTLEDDPGDAASEDDPLGMRFFDYDNDKRMDLLHTTAVDATTVYVNAAGGFASVDVTAIGAQFDVDRLELSDMNGDGLLDPVQLVTAGADAQVRYRLNLGFGNWSDAVSVTVADLSAAEFDDAELEDIDGDGLSDIVVVTGTTISYWRNLNGDRFSGRVNIGTDDVTGGIPVRDGDETVLFADMNGNGTDDVVYISSAGAVRFVELFPVRPNLLSRIENGIGWVRTLSYGTAIAERARDEGTADAWLYKNPLAMVVVKETDNFVTLSGSDGGVGLHEVARYEYRDAYYDPREKAFRGFERVRRYSLADTALDSQEPALEVLVYDVGQDDVYRAGRMLSTQTFGGADLDVPIREMRTEYSDCDLGDDLGGTPLDELEPPVRFVCPNATVVIHQEGAPEAEWITTRTERTFDRYGNVVLERSLGIVNLGSPEMSLPCGACDGPSGYDSGACGATCLGDEQTEEVTYVEPGAATGGRWLLRLPIRQRTWSDDGGDKTETEMFYDGPDFVGLAAGTATRGLLTRTRHRVSDSDFVPGTRVAYDALGNVRAALDANGDPAVTDAHRRDYEHDSRGLRVTRVVVRAGAYDLVQEASYETTFLLASEVTDFFVVEDGAEQTPRNPSRFRYDEFGRVVRILRPGDTDAAPSEEISYELGDPLSRIVSRVRRVPGGPADVERIGCVDGRGRAVQARTKVADSEYIVDGLNVVNARNNVVRSYQPYRSTSAACDSEPPSGVLATTYRYDGVGRVIETTLPDDALFGSASVTRTVYEPLATTVFDAEDTDASSPHAGTPMRSVKDGLERVTRIDRLLTPTTIGTYRLGYDDRGNLAYVEDPAGHAQTQEHDLFGRVLRSVSPNAGESTFAYDAAGLVVRAVDARGVAVVNEYDALNRRIATFEEGDRDETLEETRYDWLLDCASCRNAVGREVARTYPAGEDRMGYDPRGRMVFMERTIDGVALATEYEYDGVGALLRATYPDGQELSYTYDLASRVTSIQGVLDSVVYDAQGLLTSLTHVNGVTTSYAYDDLLRVAGIEHEGIFDLAMTRDRVGHIREITSSGSGLDRSATFTTDAWYRPTLINLAGEDVSVAYDLIDNITSMTSTRGAASAAHQGDYSYAHAAPNAVTSAGSVARDYDAAGQMTSRGGLALTWDHLGRVSEASLADHPTSRFDYVDFDRVASREGGGLLVYPAEDFIVRDGISTLYVKVGGQRVARLKSDALLPAFADVNGDGEVDVADAVAAPEGAVGRTLRAIARRLLFDAADATVALHTDWRGSVVAVSDAAGELVAERDFYPFGALRDETGFVDELGFTGQEQDELSELVHFSARYLDPDSGRWISPDPLYDTQAVDNVANLGESTTGYVYVANGPVDGLDPTGLGIRAAVARLAQSALHSKFGNNFKGLKEKLKLDRTSLDTRKNYDKISKYRQKLDTRSARKRTQRAAARMAQVDRIVTKVNRRERGEITETLTSRERHTLRVVHEELRKKDRALEKRAAALAPDVEHERRYGSRVGTGSERNQAARQEIEASRRSVAGVQAVLREALRLDAAARRSKAETRRSSQLNATFNIDRF